MHRKQTTTVDTYGHNVFTMRPRCCPARAKTCCSMVLPARAAAMQVHKQDPHSVTQGVRKYVRMSIYYSDVHVPSPSSRVMLAMRLLSNSEYSMRTRSSVLSTCDQPTHTHI